MSKIFTLVARSAAIIAILFIVYARFIAPNGQTQIDPSASPFSQEASTNAQENSPSALPPLEFEPNVKTEAIDDLFSALGEPVNAGAISQILAENAQVEIRDLEIKQSAAEYVEALEQWEQSIKGGSIKHTFIGVLEKGGELENGYELAVCYEFSSGDKIGTKDSLSFDDENRVELWVQEALDEACL